MPEAKIDERGNLMIKRKETYLTQDCMTDREGHYCGHYCGHCFLKALGT